MSARAGRARTDGKATRKVIRKATRKAPRIRLQTNTRRAQLLELGMDLFAARAYEDIAIDDLAAAAGISKGLLYHYFRGKREFYVETIRAASLRLRRLSEPDPKLQPVARLRASIDAHLNYIQEHGPAYAAIYRSGVAVAPEVSDILEEHRSVILRHFLRNLGVPRPRPVLRAALRAWISMVEGSSLDWIAHPALKRDQLRELLIAAYVATLAKSVELDPQSLPATLFHAAAS